MAKNRFVERQVDFQGIETAFAELRPPMLALEDILGRLRPNMLGHIERGVTVEQLAEALKGKGIDVGARRLKTYLEKGELSGTRKRRMARPQAESRSAEPSEDGASVASGMA